MRNLLGSLQEPKGSLYAQLSPLAEEAVEGLVLRFEVVIKVELLYAESCGLAKSEGMRDQVVQEVSERKVLQGQLSGRTICLCGPCLEGTEAVMEMASGEESEGRGQVQEQIVWVRRTSAILTESLSPRNRLRALMLRDPHPPNSNGDCVSNDRQLLPSSTETARSTDVGGERETLLIQLRERDFVEQSRLERRLQKRIAVSSGRHEVDSERLSGLGIKRRLWEKPNRERTSRQQEQRLGEKCLTRH
jgi:hypothetical protein